MERFSRWLPFAALFVLSAVCPTLAAEGTRPSDGSVLPFPPAPSASVAAPTLQESKHQRRVEQSHLPKDAPNILIILLDDVGFGLPDTYGGPIHTPTLSRIANQGISYNAFHTTSICSPTRAALLTGRNHQRVGSGTIAERAVDWDGYTGVIPQNLRHPREGAGRLRIQDRRLRQVAQHARDRDHGDGAVHPLADRRGHRLRLLLRLSRRRDLAMGAAAVRELQPDRAAARREIPPERRPGGQGDHVDAQASRVSRPTSRS